MPYVPVPVLHREGLLGPPPTQLDLVVDLAWCEVRRVGVTCTEFDRFVRPRTEGFFFVSAAGPLTDASAGCARPERCFGRVLERLTPSAALAERWKG